jgi:hypothetical protein
VDLAFLDRVLQRAGDVFDRHVRVDMMLIEQVDVVSLQADERRFGDGANVRRAAVGVGNGAVF